MVLSFCFIFFLNLIEFFLHNFSFGFEFPISGAAEVEEEDDMFILVAPQNAVGNCIIDVSG